MQNGCPFIACKQVVAWQFEQEQSHLDQYHPLSTCFVRWERCSKAEPAAPAGKAIFFLMLPSYPLCRAARNPALRLSTACAACFFCHTWLPRNNENDQNMEHNDYNYIIFFFKSYLNHIPKHIHAYFGLHIQEAQMPKYASNKMNHAVVLDTCSWQHHPVQSHCRHAVLQAVLMKHGRT